MSCFSDQDFSATEVAGRCPDCDQEVDSEGLALGGCHYSPESCETCHYRGCDGSC